MIPELYYLGVSAFTALVFYTGFTCGFVARHRTPDESGLTQDGYCAQDGCPAHAGHHAPPDHPAPQPSREWATANAVNMAIVRSALGMDCQASLAEIVRRIECLRARGLVERALVTSKN